jgi:2-polyprenyl-3-methyl-5-hydroxy-6-metoxy-1,4-benzoquinol methylase
VSAIDPIGRRVQAAYAGAPRAERLHVTGRLRSCPVAAVAEATPSTGRILDFGCGHGVVSLYLAMTAPARQITGVDVDGEKVNDARAAAKAADVAVDFEEVEPDYRPTGAWDAIVIVDVLYLLGESAAFEVIDAAADALVDGGVLVLKEIDVRPRWKYWLASGQELLATKVLRITEGSRVDFVAPGAIDARLRGRGLTVEHRPCHRGRLHPHHLIIARKGAR